MHGDDIASAGVQVITEVAPMAAKGLAEIAKGTAKLIADIIVAIKNSADKKGKELHGDVKLLSNLKNGGEMSSVTLTKEDFEAFKKSNKENYKNDVAFVAVPKGKDSDYVELYFLKNEEAPVRDILDEIVNDKLKSPEVPYKMTVLDKEQAEILQAYCAENNVPINLFETENGEIKCIYTASDELKVKMAIDKTNEIRGELKNTSIEVKKDKDGKLKFYITDTEQGKSISAKFGDSEKLERILKDHFGYSETKALTAARILKANLTDEQRRFFTSGTKLAEQVAAYEMNIHFSNESISVSEFTFTKIKLKDSPDAKLLITDKDGNYAVLSENIKDRKAVEDIIRKSLNVQGNEQINELLNKVERTGFANPPATVKDKDYTIKRVSQNGAEVTLNGKSVAIDLSSTSSAKSTLMHEFGMSEKKAEKIIGKAKKQSVTGNIIDKTKNKGKAKPFENKKKHAKGARK